MSKRIVLGILVRGRMEHVPNLQQIYTEYGCFIKTRLGLHEASDNACSPNGLHILEMIGDESKIAEMEGKISQIEGVTVQRMAFDE